jgi:hypothetical protein
LYGAEGSGGEEGEEGMWENANEGYAEWVYDEEQEEKLWDLSVGIVGVE